MSWLSDAWGGMSGAVGDVFNGATGAATDLLNSDGAQAALEAAANYANGKMTAEQARQAAADKAAAAKIPSWVLPVGIGSAVLLVVALVLSRRK
ncbi:MAG: hypothetical protein WCH86_02330 [Kiritimatiellales bacterium]